MKLNNFLFLDICQTFTSVQSIYISGVFSSVFFKDDGKLNTYK